MLLKSKKLVYSLLFAILILGFVVRIVDLGGNPPGLTWDEASLGYNAYSILKTGKDEYGSLLPFQLKSFGDYKPAVYAYTAIPFVSIFGLNEAAVRLPSVLAGTGVILVIYFLIQSLFDNKWLGLSCCLMMAVSPLAIQFSRPAFESNLALFFNSLGLLLFLKGLKKPKFFFWSTCFFILSVFTYQSSRLFVPLLMIGLYIIYKRKIVYNRWLASSMILLLLFGLVLAFLVFGLKQADRLSAMNLFAYRRSEATISQISKEDDLNINGLVFQILHGEWFAFVRGLFERYLIYFSPTLLFINGDYSPRHSVPDMGPLYFISVIFLPLGIVYLWKRLPNSSVIFLLLFIAHIPAVLSRDLISFVRALNLVLPFTIFEGAGVYLVFAYLIKIKSKASYFLGVAVILLILGNFAIFLDRYFTHAPIENSQGWLYGYKQIMEELNFGFTSAFNKVVITDTYGQPYIYYLFYTKYPPEKFQSQAVLDQPTVDVGTVRKIDNIEFRHVFWPTDRGLKNSLFVATKEELNDKDVKPFKEFKILKEVNFLDKQPALEIVRSE